MSIRTAGLAACAWAALLSVGHAADPDAALATAPAGGGAPTSAGAASTAADDATAGQISGWIHQNDDGSVAEGGSAAPTAKRTVHGEVGVGFGSNGYSSEYGVADIPVGRTGDLIVAASNSQAHFRGGYGGDRQSLAIGLYLGGASPSAQACRRGDGYGGAGSGEPGLEGSGLDGPGAAPPGFGASPPGSGFGGCRAAPAATEAQPGG